MKFVTRSFFFVLLWLLLSWEGRVRALRHGSLGDGWVSPLDLDEEDGGLARRWLLDDKDDADSPSEAARDPVAEEEAVALGRRVRSRQAHGTTTVALVISEGVVVCVDSRASMGNFVGSSETEKFLPVSRTVVATMAGSAADCAHFIRYVSARAKLYELTEGRPMTSRRVSRLLATTLRRARGSSDLSVGTMVVGIDDGVPRLCYVDSDGARVEGTLFAVGSGSPFAYSVLDARYDPNMTKDDALDLAEDAVRTATERDAFSGGFINLFFVDKRHNGHWARLRRSHSDGRRRRRRQLEPTSGTSNQVEVEVEVGSGTNERTSKETNDPPR